MNKWSEDLSQLDGLKDGELISKSMKFCLMKNRWLFRQMYIYEEQMYIYCLLPGSLPKMCI